MKCKAQTIKGGDWVFGDYSMRVSQNSIRHLITDELNNQYEIDKDTLCRDTGIKDSQGNPIFEKDLVKCRSAVGRIEWSDEDQQFKLVYRQLRTKGNLNNHLTVIGSAYSVQ